MCFGVAFDIDKWGYITIDRTLPRRFNFRGDGGVPEWLKGTGCKPVGVRLRWFESNLLHQLFFVWGGKIVMIERD